METIKLKNLKLSTNMMTANQVSSYVEDKTKTTDENNYMSFEVFPTSSDIIIGEDTGIPFPVQQFAATAQTPIQYSIDELVHTGGKIYTCIKSITKTQYIKPGETSDSLVY